MKNITAFLSRHLTAFAVLALWIKTVLVVLLGFRLSAQTAMDWILLLAAPLGSAMLIVGFSFLFGRKFHPMLLFAIQLLATGLLYANLLYYRFYIDFVTVSVLLQLNNVGGLGPSTMELASAFDLLLFADLVIIGYLVFSKNKRKSLRRPNRRRYAVWSAAAIVLTFALALFRHPYMLETEYDRKLLVQSVGLYNYQMIDIVYGFKGPVDRVLAGELDAKEALDSLQQKEKKKLPVFGTAKGKNIVLISMESTQNFVIHQKVNGQEITPFLNSLIKDSYYFSNIYDQTAQGKTSDAEFMIDTGLYPLPSGSVFVRRPENVFESLPRILKKEDGYKSFVFHGNTPEFWNRKQAYKTFGYDRFYSKSDYQVTQDNSVNYGIKDMPFLKQSVPYIGELPEPFMAKFILLTNHFPFLLDEKDQLNKPAETEEGVVNRYITTVRYQDEALKTFFKELKKTGQYENTIFVIYGDHYGISRKYEAGVHELLKQEGTPLEHLELQKIPLIVHIPGQKGKTIETIGGEIDIHSTLLYLLGIDQGTYPSLSRNLFTRSDDNPVVFRDGSLAAKDVAYLDHACYSRATGETTDEEDCAPYLQKARKQLRVSDSIIMGDLYRFGQKP